jgi:hypothetical protein
LPIKQKNRRLFMTRKRKTSDVPVPEPEAAAAVNIKKPRPVRRTLTREEAQTLIGEVFVATSCWSPVRAYRVVGLTKTAKSALLEDVPLLKVGEDDHGDGSRKIDRAFLDKFPVRDEQGKLLRDKLRCLTTQLILVGEVSDLSKTVLECTTFNIRDGAWWAGDDLDRVYQFVEY